MKLDTKWYEEYSVAWFENIVLNLLEEFIWGMLVNPPRRGGTPPKGELLSVKREMSRIMVYGWV